ncbi:S8 family serine peptidase [Natronococcus sp. A-GB1]|uniref:S8 family peptidase n=1 Tax=Natronococcus sp. A-GB1 TaxID=3037648 RepID=UPI00241E2AF9|nr:S8 family serine peptidase [Natronococcus sp. A-GB1]MDG5762053.1 S8 family serine peptidase [Natronococcus sp. A-GB1]
MTRYSHSRRRLLQGIAGTGVALSFAGLASATEDGRVQYLVVGGRGTKRRLEDEGFEVRQELADGRVMVVYGPEDAAAQLRDVRGVQAAERDVRFELEKPALEEPAQEDVEPTTLYDEFLWDKQLTESLEANRLATGAGSRVAIIDTGISYIHPDLLPNLQQDDGRRFKEGFIDSGTEEDIVVGRPVDEDDYDYDDDEEIPAFDIDFVEQHVAADVEGHGTHVGGIAAASADEGFDGTGVLGTAPGADLTSFRVFWWIEVGDEDDPVDERWAPTTTTGDVLTAIDYAAEQGYDAANLSLGTAPLPPETNREPFVQAYRKVVQNAVQQGTVVTASAGNAETDLQRGGVFSLPNSTQGAMSISATAPNDELSFYSNFGTSEIDVGAPGGGYETLEKTNIEDPDEVEWPAPTNLVFSTTDPLVEGAPYGWKAGTSMAAPQVAGLVALVRQLESGAGARQVENAIKHGAEEASGRSSPELGAGRINALHTVERVDGSGGNDNNDGNGQ